jgi:hypothetical protein
VKRVALGDKEVQIWFQNRRQTSRRKSRDLDSHGSISNPPSDITDGSVPPSSPNVGPDDGEVDLEKNETLDLSHDPKSEENPKKDQDPVDVKQTNTAETQSTESEFTSSTAILSSQSGPTETSAIPCSQESISSSYIANRRHASSMKEEDVPAQIATETRILTRSSSSAYLRISMTDDGQATIVDRAAKSPERPQSSAGPSLSRSGSLRRSYSVAGFNEDQTEPGISKSAAKMPRIAKPGRSRDSRTWEFYCDSDARNSNILSKQANQERSGSASEAIGLMRSNSSRVLHINPSKLNSPHAGHTRAVADGTKKRGALKRATTAHGRIQSNFEILADAKKPDKKGNDGEDEFEKPNTDSDKENWEPEDEQRQGQQAASQTGKRRVLGENTKVMSQSGSLGSLMAQERRSRQRGQVASKEAEDVDEEVAGFMGSGVGGGPSSQAATAGTSSGDELDCVHSLLSLSQGNWR